MSERNCVAAEVLSHYRAVGGDDTVVIGYLEKRSTEGAGMSETRVGMNGVLVQQTAGDKPQPDPTVSALDALRQAVVAQTALLRSLSEQVRLNQEAIVNWFSLNREQQAKVNNQLVGLAERLDKLERQNLAFDARWSSIDRHAALVLGHIAAIEAKLPAQDTQSIATCLPTHREIRNALARKDLKAGRRGKAKR